MMKNDSYIMRNDSSMLQNSQDLKRVRVYEDEEQFGVEITAGEIERAREGGGAGTESGAAEPVATQQVAGETGPESGIARAAAVGAEGARERSV